MDNKTSVRLPETLSSGETVQQTGGRQVASSDSRHTSKRQIKAGDRLRTVRGQMSPLVAVTGE